MNRPDLALSAATSPGDSNTRLKLSGCHQDTCEIAHIC